MRLLFRVHLALATVVFGAGYAAAQGPEVVQTAATGQLAEEPATAERIESLRREAGQSSELDEEAGLASADAVVNESRPISLPAQRTNANWPQNAGSPGLRAEHAALSRAPQRIWSAPIGEGDSRKFRITADPVVAQGRIYTLDAKSTVIKFQA